MDNVNFSVRSIIAPDPCVATDVGGVPESIARTLSYLEKVTPNNETIKDTDKYSYLQLCAQLQRLLLQSEATEHRQPHKGSQWSDVMDYRLPRC